MGEMVTVGVDRKEGDKPQNIQVARGAGFSRGLGVGCGAEGIRDASPGAVVPAMMAQGGKRLARGEEGGRGSSQRIQFRRLSLRSGHIQLGMCDGHLG